MMRRGNHRLLQWLILAVLLPPAWPVYAESCTGWSALWGPCNGIEQTQTVFKIPAGCSGGSPGSQPAPRTRSCSGDDSEVGFSADFIAGELKGPKYAGYMGAPAFFGLSQGGSVTITKTFPASCGLRSAYVVNQSLFLHLQSSCTDSDDTFAMLRYTHGGNSTVLRRAADATFQGNTAGTRAWYFTNALHGEMGVGENFTLEFLTLPAPVQCDSYSAAYGSCDGYTQRLNATVSPEHCTLPPDGQGEPLVKSCSDFEAGFEAAITAGQIYGSLHGSNIGYQAPAGNVGGNLLAAGTVAVTKTSDDIGDIQHVHARYAGDVTLRLPAGRADDDSTFRSMRLARGGSSRILRRAAASYTTTGDYVQWHWAGVTGNPIHPLSTGDTFDIAFALNSQPCSDWNLGPWSSCAADPLDAARKIQTRAVSALPAGCAPPLPDRPAEQHVCNTCGTQGSGRDWNIGCFHELTDRLSAAPVCAGSWGGWTPDTNTQCPDTTVTQTSACDNPAALERTRRRAGTKSAGC